MLLRRGIDSEVPCFVRQQAVQLMQDYGVLPSLEGFARDSVWSTG